MAGEGIVATAVAAGVCTAVAVGTAIATTVVASTALVVSVGAGLGGGCTVGDPVAAAVVVVRARVGVGLAAPAVGDAVPELSAARTAAGLLPAVGAVAVAGTRVAVATFDRFARADSPPAPVQLVISVATITIQATKR